jgi:hypothetical protein
MNVVSGYPKTVDHDRTRTIGPLPVYEYRQSVSKLVAALSKLPLQNLFIVAIEDGSVREELPSTISRKIASMARSSTFGETWTISGLSRWG